MAKSPARTRPAAGETLEMNAGPVVRDADVAPQRAPLTVHRSHRRPLGAHPVPLLGGLGSLALLVAVILLVADALVAGVLVLMLAVALLTVFFGGVRREPDAPAAEPTMRALDRLGSLVRVASVTGRVWAHAGVELLRIRRRQHRLRGEFKATLAPLGEAVHRDDQQRARAIKRRAAALEVSLQDTEREASAVIAGARQEIERERTGIEPTQLIDLGAQATPPKINTAPTTRPGSTVG